DGPRVLVRPDAGGGASPPARASSPHIERPVDNPRARMEQLLQLTAERGASDLHLRVGEQPILRADGELVRQEGAVLEAAALEAMLVSIMPSLEQSAFQETGDADWAYEIGGVRFRCNAARERRGPLGVFRVIPSRIL